MAAFSVKKWYMDLANARGDVYIGYSVSLKWGRLEMNGQQHLWRSLESGVQTRTEIKKGFAPEFESTEKLTWKPAGLEGTWESIEKPFEAVLLQNEDGKIVWRCAQPKAHASVRCSGIPFSGWGYTELTDITIPVWKLPFRRLWWGRCHTDNHYLVWIRWDGGTQRHLGWFDGRYSEDLTVGDNRIAGPDFQLELAEGITLRHGKIGSTILYPFEKLGAVLPGTILSIDEHKWYNTGTLRSRAGPESAIVIHELVSW